MGQAHSPRHGSMQFWPRSRAKRESPRVRAVKIPNNSLLDGFYGYKAGMTQMTAKDTGANSLTKNKVVVQPVTIIECPPLKVAGIRYYRHGSCCGDSFFDKLDKQLSRALFVPSKSTSAVQDFDDVRMLAYAQPWQTGLSKKTPEFFEIRLQGTKEEKLVYLKEHLGKEISVSDVFKIHDLVDIHAVTKGKGFQGPVKRFGVRIRRHKSEKTKRGPGSLGAWCAQQHIMYRVAHAGQTGYHLRTEYNKPVFFMSNDTSQINPAGGLVRYGMVKSTYLIIGGSIPGPKKRFLRITHAFRPNRRSRHASLQFQNAMVESQQG